MDYDIPRNKHKYADFKDVKLEHKFLGGLLHNETAFKKIMADFDSQWFTHNRLKKIYDTIVDYYISDGEMINHIALIENMSIANKYKKRYKALWKKIKRVGKKYKSLKYLISAKHRLELLYDARVIEIGTRDTLVCLNNAMEGKHDEIDVAKDVINNTSQVLGQKQVATIIADPIDKFDEFMNGQKQAQKNPEKKRGVPTGIKPIDREITGLRDSEFGLCIGDTGIGKSIFLLDVAVNCWKKHGNVLYITIEMPYQQIMSRFWCHNTKIDYSYFRKNALTRKHKGKLKRFHKKYLKSENKFKIIDMPRGCSVASIAGTVDSYLKTNDLGLIVIDYMNIMQGAGQDEISMDWETQLGIAMNLKQKIARRFKKPVWSACQETGDSVAFSSHISDNIDIGVRFAETEMTDETGIMEITYPKARDFGGRPHNIKTNRNIMTMYHVGRNNTRLTQPRTGARIVRRNENDE